MSLFIHICQKEDNRLANKTSLLFCIMEETWEAYKTENGWMTSRGGVMKTSILSVKAQDRDLGWTEVNTNCPWNRLMDDVCVFDTYAYMMNKCICISKQLKTAFSPVGNIQRSMDYGCFVLIRKLVSAVIFVIFRVIVTFFLMWAFKSKWCDHFLLECTIVCLCKSAGFFFYLTNLLIWTLVLAGFWSFFELL
jgi:hypothetical protein